MLILEQAQAPEYSCLCTTHTVTKNITHTYIHTKMCTYTHTQTHIFTHMLWKDVCMREAATSFELFNSY